MWPWERHISHQMAQSERQKRSHTVVPRDCQLLLQSAPSLSPRDRPPGGHLLLPAPSVTVQVEWVRDQVLAMRGKTQFLKRLSSRRGERPASMWLPGQLSGFQSAGRTAPSGPYGPQAGALAPFPAAHPVMPEHLGLTAHTQGLQGLWHFSWNTSLHLTFSTALGFIYGFVANSLGGLHSYGRMLLIAFVDVYLQPISHRHLSRGYLFETAHKTRNQGENN